MSEERQVLRCRNGTHRVSNRPHPPESGASQHGLCYFLAGGSLTRPLRYFAANNSLRHCAAVSYQSWLASMCPHQARKQIFFRGLAKRA